MLKETVRFPPTRTVLGVKESAVRRRSACGGTVREHVAVTSVTPVPAARTVTVVVPAAAPVAAENVTVPELLVPGCA
jgi:hypothetical protein